LGEKISNILKINIFITSDGKQYTHFDSVFSQPITINNTSDSIILYYTKEIAMNCDTEFSKNLISEESKKPEIIQETKECQNCKEYKADILEKNDQIVKLNDEKNLTEKMLTATANYLSLLFSNLNEIGIKGTYQKLCDLLESYNEIKWIENVENLNESYKQFFETAHNIKPEKIISRLDEWKNKPICPQIISAPPPKQFYKTCECCRANCNISEVFQIKPCNHNLRYTCYNAYFYIVN